MKRIYLWIVKLGGMRGGSWNGMKRGGAGVSLNAIREVINFAIKV